MEQMGKGYCMAADGTKQLFEVNFPGFDLHCDPCKPNYKW
jgi:hypothetical protein